MSRSFSAYQLVTLPRLSAPTALALGTELVTVFGLQAEPSAALARAAERLEGSLEALRSSRQRLIDAQKLDAGAALAADRRLDAGWAALYLLLQAWAKLPDQGPGADGVGRARHLVEIIFPQGLSFTQVPYKIEWAESQARLDWLAEPANAEHVRALGGASFVAEIREAYEAYGEALQITARRAEAKAVRVREPLDEVVTALRRYVLAVAAYADDREDDEAALALAEALLAPLAAWQSPRGRKGRGRGEPADEIGKGEPTGERGNGEPTGEAGRSERGSGEGGSKGGASEPPSELGGNERPLVRRGVRPVRRAKPAPSTGAGLPRALALPGELAEAARDEGALPPAGL